MDRLWVDLAVRAVNLLGDFRAPLTDPPGDLRVEGLAVESMTQDGRVPFPNLSESHRIPRIPLSSVVNTSGDHGWPYWMKPVGLIDGGSPGRAFVGNSQHVVPIVTDGPGALLAE